MTSIQRKLNRKIKFMSLKKNEFAFLFIDFFKTIRFSLKIEYIYNRNVFLYSWWSTHLTHLDKSHTDGAHNKNWSNLKTERNHNQLRWRTEVTFPYMSACTNTYTCALRWISTVSLQSEILPIDSISRVSEWVSVATKRMCVYVWLPILPRRPFVPRTISF